MPARFRWIFICFSSENQDILNELAAEVWEESGNLQPGNDLEREKYKREARQLLKRIEHKKRTWFRRASVVAVSTAAVIAIIIGLSLIHI